MFIAVNSKIFKILNHIRTIGGHPSKASIVSVRIFQRIFFSQNVVSVNIDVGILGNNTNTCGMYV